jgi:hypothetical protein
MKEFDYYIFIDYSENLIGYPIIERNRLMELLPKISRLRHYRTAGNRKLYIRNVRKSLKKDNVKSAFLKLKIKEMPKNMEIYLDVLEFLKKHENCIIFVSVDNKQYPAFRKMVNIVDCEEVVVKQESELIIGTPEYQASLVLDNILNIERLKE